MNIESAIFSFETVKWLVMAAIGIYAWVIGRQSASAQELLDLRTRIATLESEMRQIPSQKQLHELSLRVERVNGAVDSLRENLNPMRESLRRMENFLLDSKGK